MHCIPNGRKLTQFRRLSKHHDWETSAHSQRAVQTFVAVTNSTCVLGRFRDEAESFDKIPSLLSYSKALKRLVMLGFLISFSYNILGLSFAIQGMLSPVMAAILMPLSSISVVAFAIFSTSLAAKKHNIF